MLVKPPSNSAVMITSGGSRKINNRGPFQSPNRPTIKRKIRPNNSLQGSRSKRLRMNKNKSLQGSRSKFRSPIKRQKSPPINIAEYIKNNNTIDLHDQLVDYYSAITNNIPVVLKDDNDTSQYMEEIYDNNKQITKLDNIDSIKWFKKSFGNNNSEIHKLIDSQYNNPIEKQVADELNLFIELYNNVIKAITNNIAQVNPGRRNRNPNPFKLPDIQLKFRNFIKQLKLVGNIVKSINGNLISSVGSLTAEHKSVGDTCLASIAYYITRTTQRNYPELFDVATKGSSNTDRYNESDTLIILLIRKLIKFIQSKSFKYYEAGEDKLYDIKLPNNSIYYDITPANTPDYKFKSDWEDQLLKIITYVFNNPDVYTKSRPKPKGIKPTDYMVINNGVVDLSMYGLHTYKALCSVGNAIDGYKNPKCPRALIQKEPVDSKIIKSFNLKFDSNDTYNLTIKSDKTVTVKVDLLLGNDPYEMRNKLSIYSPGNTQRLGTNELKTRVITEDLEAANVAHNAFITLFESNQLTITPRTNETQREFTRLHVLLYTEFLDDPTYKSIREIDGRSLFNKFYGCFITKTTGDTTQYIEANTNHLMRNKYIYKVDNDRPAWVGDLVFRILAKPHFTDKTKVRTNTSASGLLSGDKEWWCDDTNIKRLPQENGMMAWKMIFMVDTFHDYGSGAMADRFRKSLDQLSLLSRRATPNNRNGQIGGGYDTDTDTDNEIRSMIDCFMTSLIMNNINKLLNSDATIKIKKTEYFISKINYDIASNQIIGFTFPKLIKYLKERHGINIAKLFIDEINARTASFNDNILKRMKLKLDKKSRRTQQTTKNMPSQRSNASKLTRRRRHIIPSQITKALSKQSRNWRYPQYI
jgi:hypothetical protein